MNHEHITPLSSAEQATPFGREPDGALGRSARSGPATVAVRTGIEDDQHHGAVVAPLHMSSNFTFAGLGEKRRYDYTRSGNPTRDLLAQALSRLEHGAGAAITCSGMSAVHLVLQLVPTGGCVVAPHDCYGGTFRLLESAAERGQFDVRFVDQSCRQSLRESLRGADLLWIETPSNPLLRIIDIRRAARLARRERALVAVDNTFLSPARQRPIDLGADLVVHSTTKYINGHSDVVGGAVVAKDSQLAEKLDYWCNCLGLSASPFDCYQTLRGLRTLEARWRVHEENVAAVVDLLASHPAVRCVHHPSLEHHPGHQIARWQQLGFGAMVSFELAGGEEDIAAFLNGLECFSLAESLGGVESLIAHPATMTHAVMSAEARAAAGISDGLLRLSVGLEAAEDLVADLRRALARVAIRSAG